MSYITDIELINYRSFREARCHLSPFTLIVGANNAGKSNLLRAVSDLANFTRVQENADYLKSVAHHARPSGVDTQVSLKWSDEKFTAAVLSKQEAMLSMRQQRYFVISGPNNDLQSKPGFIRFNLEIPIAHLDPTIIGGPEGGAGEPWIEANGKGVSWTLDKWNSGAKPLRERFESVMADMRRCVPEIERISFYDIEQGKRAIQVEQTGLPDPVPLNEVSDGTRIVLALLTLLNVEPPPPVLLLEDIDRGLHPRLYEQLVVFLRSVAAEGRAQILATTHNPDLIEPLHHIASVGIVRACQKGENDTSNLLLQGLCRVTVKKIVREDPYRIIAVQPIATSAGTHHAELEILRLEVMRLLHLRRRLGTPAPKGMTQFLESIDDIDTFADIAVFNLCTDSATKQQLLETLETRRRLQLFAAALKSEIEAQRLRRKLQGHLSDDHIADN